MKANPDYQWHQSKKESSPPTKPSNKQTLSSVGETSEKIVPGLLAGCNAFVLLKNNIIPKLSIYM